MDKNHSNKNDNTEEDEEEEEEESEDEEETSQSDDSSHVFHRSSSLQNHNQQKSSSTSSSAPSSVAADSEDDLDEKLCPAAQLLLSRKPSPKRKNNSMSSESSPNHGDIQNIKSSPKRRQNNHTQTEDIITDTNTTNNNHINSTEHNSYQRNRKSSQSSRMNSIFMQERLDEEDEDQDDSEDDRPIRGSMKVREDTMDGAENPDTDPPQRRRTLEDISITELSTLRASLPPEYPEDESPPTLLPCLTCNRTFNPKALDRHRNVCQKISQTGKKKQVFNALTQRFEGLDSSPLPGTGRATTPERKTTPPSKKASRWREKHQEFLRTIRAARGTPEGDADVGAPVPSVPSDYIKCPCCERHFGPKAAERHIDWCKEQSTRLRRNSAETHLVERLKTRTKYVPPKPGQSGWRAPKKTDVISSIPPPATGDRRISPPPGTPLALRRGISPGPPNGSRHPGGTASLGRSAARSFSSLLQAVTGSYSSPYGQRPSVSQSGYATPSSYSAYGGTSGGGSQTPNLVRSGSFSGMDPEGTFARSASLRLPNTRRSSGGRIARRRDLASDMLASVCLGGNPARGEPEGNEADDFSSRETTLSPPPYTKSLLESKFDSSFVSAFNSEYDSSKYDSSFDSKYDSKYDTALDAIDTSYDPYSAAEMQMQALLGPTQGGGGLGSTGLGAAGLGLGKLGSFLDEKTRQQISPKKRLSKLNTSLSPLGRRSSRQMSPSVSDILSSSPGPDYTSDKRNWRLSPSPPPQRDRWSPSPQSPTHAWSPTRSSPGRWGNESPCWNREDRLSITSLSGGSRDGGRYSASSGNTSNREDRGLSPSTNPPREDRFSLSSGGSCSLREDRYSSGSLSRDGRFSSISSASSRTDRFSTGSNTSSLREDRWSTSSRNTAIRRTSGNGDSDVFLARKSCGGEPPPSSSLDTGSSLASLKALRTALQVDGNASKKYFDSPVEPSQPNPERISSGSSTDSSLPLLSSRSSSVSPSGTAKAGIRGDAVGGHSEEPLITPRIDGATRTERPLFASSRVTSNPCGEESLQKAISSLSSIGEMPALVKSGSLSMESKTTVGVLDSDSKAPKFCYECGHRYPVSLAKFCCHCGCRRAPVDN